jgi:hypothetical protein
MKTLAKVLGIAVLAVAANELWERVKPLIVAKALEVGAKDAE